MSEETHIHTIVLNTIMTDGQPIDEDEMMEKALGPIEFIDANNEVIATFDDVGWLIEDWKGENGERFRYVPRWRKRQQEEKNDGHNVYPVDDVYTLV